MALDPVVNFFRSTIATLPLNSGTTTMVLASGDGNKLPDPAVDGAFNLVVYDPSDPFVAPEIVRCTARTSDTLTISRGQEGTSDATKAAGIAWTVELVPTAKTIQDIDSKKVEKTGDTMTGTLTATKLIPSGNVTAGNGMYLPTTNTLAFSTNGAERVRVNASGDVGIGTTAPASKLHVTGLTRSTSGINFNASGGSTLDSYEEGTWTPVYIGATTAGTASYSIQTGSYTRVGRQVTVQFYITWSGGTGTGAGRITGLPFTSANVNNRVYFNTGIFSNYTLTASNVGYFSIVPNTSFIGVDQYPVGGGAATNTAYDAAGSLGCIFSYFV
jgi:hypothetical protein